MYSVYYQAQVVPKDTWFLVAALRSFEHLQFDRTYDAKTGVFEFFVPEGNEAIFVEILNYFQDKGIVQAVHKLPNRLSQPGSSVQNY